jgi:tRNA(fMet)-specific endonuclease VapC
MTYLIDTNIFIILLKHKGPDGWRISEKLAREPEAEICTSSIVEAELWHGAEKYEVPVDRRAQLATLLGPYHSLPFDSRCVPHYAKIRHSLEKQGQLIGANDLLIAATALAHGLTLVTHNGSEFARVPDLQWEDWA